MTKEENEKLDKEVRKKIVDILGKISYLFDYTSKKTLGEAIEACKNDKDAKEGILRTFGVRFEVIEELYRVNIITDDIATMLYEIGIKGIELSPNDVNVNVITDDIATMLYEIEQK